MSSYIVHGESREVGALGVTEAFTLKVDDVDNEEAARETVRLALYAVGREHVLCKSVLELPLTSVGDQVFAAGQVLDLFMTAIDAGSLTCTEAETVADALRVFGRDDDAGSFIEAHAESDQDVEDVHHDRYLASREDRSGETGDPGWDARHEDENGNIRARLAADDDVDAVGVFDASSIEADVMQAQRKGM